MAFIEVHHLVKIFRRPKRKEGFRGAMHNLVRREYEIKTAVDDISFAINQGEIVGYIGPNGAGKSTTIKILSGILVPTSGQVFVSGIIPYQNRITNAKNIGVVFGQRTQLWWDIPISESFNLMRYMYKIPPEIYRTNLELCSEILGLEEFINVSVRLLSLGQRMRADLCASLLHNPKILFLDEPTIGLDVMVKERIRLFIKEINERYQTTVILTTHDMSDIEKLCSRVMVIDRGRIMYNDKLEGLKNLFGTWETIRADLEAPELELGGLYQLGVNDVSRDGNHLTILYDRKKVNSTVIIRWLMDNGILKDFQVNQTEIEEVIRNLYTSLQSGRNSEMEIVP